MRERFRKVFGCDLRSLAIFRIALAFLIFYDVLARFPDAEAFYSDSGFFSIEYAKEESPPSFSINYLSGSVAFQQTIFVVLAIFATTLAAGLFTRISTFVCWILLISIHIRNPFVLIGGDTLLRLLLFWSLFIPLGRVWSVDHWLNKRKKKKELSSRDTLLVSAGTACLIIQVCLMYWCAGICKLTETWLDGTAMEYVLRLSLYVRPAGEWVLTQPLLLKFIAYSTLVIELAIPFFLFIPIWTEKIRLLVILIFWGLHLGIEMTLDVGNFGCVSMVSWLPLLPGFVFQCCCCCSKREKETYEISGGRNQNAEASEADSTGSRSAGRCCGWWASAVPVAFLIYIVLWNYSGLDLLQGSRWHLKLSKEFQRPGWVTMVAQNFQMFGEPPKFDPTFVFNGRTIDGREIDLIQDRLASESRPDGKFHNVVTAQWKKIHRFLLRHPGNSRFHQALLDYYTRTWNQTHSGGEQVVESRLECYYSKTGPEFQAGAYVRKPDLATWKLAASDEVDNKDKTDDQIIDEVDSFMKSLEQSPIK